MNLMDLFIKIGVDDQASKGIKDIGKTIQDAKKPVEEYRRDVMKLAQTYKSQGMDMSSAMKKAYSEIDKSQYETAENSKNDSKKFSDNWVDAGEKVSGIAKKIGNGLKTAAKIGTAALTAAGTAIMGIGTFAVKAGSNFEAQMSKVSAISGATGDDFDALKEKAKQLGIDTKFSATEAAQAFEYMAMAGWKTEDMLNGVAGIMDLAAAAGEDLASVSDIVTDALTAFGLSAADSGHFADVLAAASSNANTNVAMMGETFKYVAPVAGSLGYSVEDVAVAIGLMANAGIKSSQAGTALRSALTRLVDPTKEAKEALAGLGLMVQEQVPNYDKLSKAESKLEKAHVSLEKKTIKYNQAVEKYGKESSQAALALIDLETAQKNVNDAMSNVDAAQNAYSYIDKYNSAILNADGSMKSFSETVGVLREAFSGLSESEKASYASTLFGQEAMSGMLAIINASDEEFNKLAASIDAADGSAQNMAETMINNLQGQLTLIKSSAEGFGLAIYEHLQTPLTDLASEGVEALNSLTSAFNKGGIQEVIAKGGELLGKAIVKVVEFTPQIISAATDLISSFVDALSNNQDLIASSAVAIITQLATAFLKMLPQIVKLGLDLVISLANGIAKSLPELIPTVVDVILQIVDTLTNPDSLAELLNAALAIILAIATGLVDAIPQLVDAALTIVDNLVLFLLDHQNIFKIWDASLQIILALAEGLIKSIPRVWESIILIVGEMVSAFFSQDWKELGADLMQKLLDGIKSLIPTFFSVGSDVVDAIKEGISSAWDSLTSWFDDLWSRLTDRTIKIGTKVEGESTHNSGKLVLKAGGSHKSGLDYVPYDNYLAILHKGERVLTAKQNQGYTDRSAQGITIVQNIQAVPQTPVETASATRAYFEEARWAF